jgi:hypothetical protein
MANTATTLDWMLNKPALFFVGEMSFDVIITDLKVSYGKIRYEIAPVSGNGRKWVEDTCLNLPSRP